MVESKNASAYKINTLRVLQVIRVSRIRKKISAWLQQLKLSRTLYIHSNIVMLIFKDIFQGPSNSFHRLMWWMDKSELPVSPSKLFLVSILFYPLIRWFRMYTIYSWRYEIPFDIISCPPPAHLITYTLNLAGHIQYMKTGCAMLGSMEALKGHVKF